MLANQSSIVTLWGRLLALPLNIRQSWKSGTNALAYYKQWAQVDKALLPTKMILIKFLNANLTFETFEIYDQQNWVKLEKKR